MASGVSTTTVSADAFASTRATYHRPDRPPRWFDEAMRRIHSRHVAWVDRAADRASSGDAVLRVAQRALLPFADTSPPEPSAGLNVLSLRSSANRLHSSRLTVRSAGRQYPGVPVLADHAALPQSREREADFGQGRVEGLRELVPVEGLAFPQREPVQHLLVLRAAAVVIGRSSCKGASGSRGVSSVSSHRSQCCSASQQPPWRWIRPGSPFQTAGFGFLRYRAPAGRAESGRRSGASAHRNTSHTSQKYPPRPWRWKAGRWRSRREVSPSPRRVQLGECLLERHRFP